MSETRTATTPHGEVEYEVVTCDSCGNDVAKEDAKDFFIGDVDEITDYHGQEKVYFDTLEQGKACPICADDEAVDGPISFPGTGRTSSLTHSIGQAMLSLFTSLTVVIVKIFVTPYSVVSKELQNQGFDEMDAEFFAGLFIIIWIIALVLFSLAVGGHILVALFA